MHSRKHQLMRSSRAQQLLLLERASCLHPRLLIHLTTSFRHLHQPPHQLVPARTSAMSLVAHLCSLPLDRNLTGSTLSPHLPIFAHHLRPGRQQRVVPLQHHLLPRRRSVLVPCPPNPTCQLLLRRRRLQQTPHRVISALSVLCRWQMRGQGNNGLHLHPHFPWHSCLLRKPPEERAIHHRIST